MLAVAAARLADLAAPLRLDLLLGRVVLDDHASRFTCFRVHVCGALVRACCPVLRRVLLRATHCLTLVGDGSSLRLCLLLVTCV